MKQDIVDILYMIKESIENEDVSWAELTFLTDHKKEILELGDIRLAEWAGIDEEEYQRGVDD